MATPQTGGSPVIPHLTGVDPKKDQAATNDFLRDLWNMAHQLTFLCKDGTITSGQRAHNIDGVWLVYTSNAVADTEDAVTHALGRTPAGFYQGIPNKAGVAYLSVTNPTKTTIYLKANIAALTVNLFLF